jgi:hypothetical protein
MHELISDFYSSVIRLNTHKRFFYVKYMSNFIRSTRDNEEKSYIYTTSIRGQDPILYSLDKITNWSVRRHDHDLEAYFSWIHAREKSPRWQILTGLFTSLQTVKQASNDWHGSQLSRANIRMCLHIEGWTNIKSVLRLKTDFFQFN